MIERIGHADVADPGGHFVIHAAFPVISYHPDQGERQYKSPWLVIPDEIPSLKGQEATILLVWRFSNPRQFRLGELVTVVVRDWVHDPVGQSVEWV